MVATSSARGRQAGFGLADAWVGLLLLAGGTVLMAQMQRQALHLLHDAGLRMQAVDLAADLGESLRAATGAAQAATALAHWQARVSATLPRTGSLQAGLSAAAAGPVPGALAWQNISLRWQVAGDHTESFSLPVAGTPAP